MLHEVITRRVSSAVTVTSVQDACREYTGAVIPPESDLEPVGTKRWSLQTDPVETAR
jgi:hypothetical protein